MRTKSHRHELTRLKNRRGYPLGLPPRKRNMCADVMLLSTGALFEMLNENRAGEYRKTEMSVMCLPSTDFQ